MLRTKRTRPKPGADAIASSAYPIRGERGDYDALLELIGDASVVLIGEASHGTHEFYAERAAITRRLILERNFGAVCIEGDWPDAYRVDCYLKGRGADRSPESALLGFRRFPTWMWRNEVVRDFVRWARSHNDAQAERDQVGFYGLDLYSMFASIQRVLAFLDRVDPAAAVRARHRYACFEHFGEDSQSYGYATTSDLAESCEEDAIRQLVDVQSQAPAYAARDGRRALDESFSAEQNARLVVNAERYYRSMFRGRASSWNLRDRHMAETLDALRGHLDATGRQSRVVVWAHNSHLGDAQHTDMRRRGEINLGQLARELYGDQVRLIGFSTHTGTVTAAHDWDEPGRRMRVRPSRPDSYERCLSDAARESGIRNYYLSLRERSGATDALASERLQRAIGVIYRPESERVSHYYEVDLVHQFDAIIHLDETRALRGLEPGEHWERDMEEPPETYPSGI